MGAAGPLWVGPGGLFPPEAHRRPPHTAKNGLASPSAVSRLRKPDSEVLCTMFCTMGVLPTVFNLKLFQSKSFTKKYYISVSIETSSRGREDGEGLVMQKGLLWG